MGNRDGKVMKKGRQLWREGDYMYTQLYRHLDALNICREKY